MSHSEAMEGIKSPEEQLLEAVSVLEGQYTDDPELVMHELERLAA